MNFIDKVIGFLNPSAGLRREISRMQTEAIRQIRVRNTGYSESGASRVKKSLRGWTANSKSPFEDIDLNLDTLRQRSRDLYMGAPLATSAVKTNRTNVVGSGLRLKAQIDYEFLGMTPEQANAWEINTEREFGVWADSIWCDALRLNNFYELQQVALMSWLLNGDGFALIKHVDPTGWMPYGLRIHLIEADRVCNPNSFGITLGVARNEQNGNRILNGVEIDESGAVVAYWICNQYPNSTLATVHPDSKQWVRVEAFGENTGAPNILHLMEQERCEQYRGVPYLAPVIESLKQISRYAEAELTAAVIQAFFTAFIVTKSDNDDAPLFNQTIDPTQRIDQDPSANSYELGAGTINILEPGEDVKFADPSRPTSGFDAFVTAMAKYVGAALEVPYELLTKSFTASYSASRAALLEAWKAFRMRRTWFANDFCQPVYELWLSEAVARGRINAPGFFNDPAKRKAWCKADWNGPAPGQIDPTKEVEAAIKRVSEGFSTRERETIELTGGDWDKNIEQIIRENSLLRMARMSSEEQSEPK